MATATREFYKARTSFATIIDGRPVVVKQGELVGEGDPLLGEGRLQLFDLYEAESRFDQLGSGARRISEPAPVPDYPLGLTEDPTPKEIRVTETRKVETIESETTEVPGQPDTKVTVEETPREVTTTKVTTKPETKEVTSSKVPR